MTSGWAAAGGGEQGKAGAGEPRDAGLDRTEGRCGWLPAQALVG